MKTVLGILGFTLSLVVAFVFGCAEGGMSVKAGEGYWNDVIEVTCEYFEKHFG